MSTKNNSLRGGKLAGGQGATPTASASSNSKKAQVPKKTNTINTAASPTPVANSVAAPTENENDANMGHASADQDAGMSDDEDSALLLRMESDVSLPRAPVKQLIMEKLPQSARIHQQSKELISNLCMQFLMQLAEEANEFCSAQNKKTVCPDHVLDALIKMNLTRYFPTLAGQEDDSQLQQPNNDQQVQQEDIVTHTTTNMGRGARGAAGRKQSVVSAKAQQTAQAALQQSTQVPRKLNPANPQDLQQLRNAIMGRLNRSMEDYPKMRGLGKNRGGADKDYRSDGSMNDAQKNLEQEKLFREAREQYDNQQNVGEYPQPYGYGGGLEQQPMDPCSANGVDAATPMQVDANQMVEPRLPPFIPTDYFRDLIYSTDFMNEDDNGDQFNAPQLMVPAVLTNMTTAEQVQDDVHMMPYQQNNNLAADGDQQLEQVNSKLYDGSQINATGDRNFDDCEYAPENNADIISNQGQQQNMQQAHTFDRGDTFGQTNVAHEAAMPEVFSFEFDDYEELDDFNQMEAARLAASSGKLEGSENNAKPKEQNDQEMREESKQQHETAQ